MRKPTFWFLTWSDTNQAVQSQKMASGLKFWIKKEGLYIRATKTKALISFAVATKLICVFVFAYATCWFSHDVAHIKYRRLSIRQNFNHLASTCWMCMFIYKLDSWRMENSILFSGRQSRINSVDLDKTAPDQGLHCSLFSMHPLNTFLDHITSLYIYLQTQNFWDVPKFRLLTMITNKLK